MCWNVVDVSFIHLLTWGQRSLDGLIRMDLFFSTGSDLLSLSCLWIPLLALFCLTFSLYIHWCVILASETKCSLKQKHFGYKPIYLSFSCCQVHPVYIMISLVLVYINIYIFLIIKKKSQTKDQHRMERTISERFK